MASPGETVRGSDAALGLAVAVTDSGHGISASGGSLRIR